MTADKIMELGSKAATKAMTDSTFRATLVADGNAAIKSEFNEEVPVKVTFHEFSDKKLVFVLPPKQTTDGELDDEVLDGVTGGFISNRAICGYAAFPINLNKITL